jgi:hypothetical protein
MNEYFDTVKKERSEGNFSPTFDKLDRLRV